MIEKSPIVIDKMEFYNYTIKTDNYHKNFLLWLNKIKFLHYVFCKLMQFVFLIGVQLYAKTTQSSPVLGYTDRWYGCNDP